MEAYTPLLRSLVQGTVASNTLPDSHGNFQFYNSFPSFQRPMTKLNGKVLDLIMKLANKISPDELSLEDIDSEDYDKFGYFNDSLMEKARRYLDIASGDTSNVQSTVSKSAAINSGSTNPSVGSSSQIEKPQIRFSDEIDNSESPFMSKLSIKPFAIVPLDVSLSLYRNPYEPEIRNWEPSAQQLVPGESQMYLPLHETPCVWVSSLEDLQLMIASLSEEDSVAIDLEANNMRSYQGFLCLMQVSSRTQDWLVDVIVLRDYMHLINEVTANPAIEKVLHGSNMDIQWLQRDFGVYIVNMFDTGQASRTLGFPSAGLAYLLKEMCNVQANKKFQTADWRVRPLNDEMTKYAREDTHYLLYIRDELKKRLFSKSNSSASDKGSLPRDLIREVYMSSRDICLTLYEKKPYSVDNAEALMIKYDLRLSSTGRSVFLVLDKWRDDIARREDESVHYVLPNHILAKIASSTPLTVSQLYSCCVPVPPLVAAHGQEIIALIVSAKKSFSTDAPGKQDVIVSTVPVPTRSMIEGAPHGSEITSTDSSEEKEFVLFNGQRVRSIVTLSSLNGPHALWETSTSTAICGPPVNDSSDSMKIADAIRSSLSITAFLVNCESMVVDDDSTLARDEEEVGERDSTTKAPEYTAPLSLNEVYSKKRKVVGSSLGGEDSSLKKRRVTNEAGPTEMSEDDDDDSKMVKASFDYDGTTTTTSGATFNPFLKGNQKLSKSSRNNTFVTKKITTKKNKIK